VKKLVDELEQILSPDIFTAEERKKQKPINKDLAVNLLSVFITEVVHLISFNTNADIFEELFFKN
jgi:hypothetical protein